MAQKHKFPDRVDLFTGLNTFNPENVATFISHANKERFEDKEK